MIKVSEPIVGEREVAAVSEVLLSGRYVQGPKVAEFEKAFADYVGAKHGVAVATGTAALHISLAANGIGPGDEVIVPPLTFFSTVTSVLHQNAIPIFADIQDDNYCLDPSDVARCVTDRTRAIIPVHLYGHPAEMDKLMMVAEEYELSVIEDCAQAHGARYHGSRVGSIGQVGCFSFYATKNMTTGEGGIIVTDDEDIANRCRLIRSHGMSDRDTHAVLGFNYRMTDMAGAMGIVQLDRLEELNAIRVKNSIPDYVEHVYFWCPVQIRENVLGMDTKGFVSLLRKHNVEVRHRYSEPLYRQPLLTDNSLYPLCCEHYRDAPDYGSLSLPVVESVAGKMIGLPNHPGLSLADMDKVLEVFHQI